MVSTKLSKAYFSPCEFLEKNGHFSHQTQNTKSSPKSVNHTRAATSSPANSLDRKSRVGKSRNGCWNGKFSEPEKKIKVHRKLVMVKKKKINRVEKGFQRVNQSLGLSMVRDVHRLRSSTK
jgi:hypothetical protein